MPRQLAKQLIDRQAELGGQLSQILIAECVLELIDRDRQVLAVAQPRGHLRPEPRLLQLLQQSADAAEIGLAEHLRQNGGKPSGLPGQSPQCSAQNTAEYITHESLL